jgi:outer membrane lipoprotein-sorting protein
LRNRNSWFALLIAAALACGGLPARAADAWGLPQLMQSLAQVKSARGTFVEHKYLSIVNTPLEYKGGLAYTAPDRLEKLTETPKAERMVLEGDKLTLENSRKQRRVVMLAEYPVIRAFVESIRSTLAGDLPTLQRYYTLTLEGKPDEWRLVLVPIEPTMLAVVKEIRISGANAHVANVEITEKEGDRSVMTITAVAP